MRIAFDVKGTIEGPKKKFVLALLYRLQDLGHEVIVWSNSYGYAVDAVRDNALKAEATSKRGKGDYGFDDSTYVDVAVEDDTGQTWLAAKSFVWVNDIPEDMGSVFDLAMVIHNSQK